MAISEDRIKELEDRKIEFIQLEQQRENKLRGGRKKEQSLRDCGTKTKDPTFISSEPQKAKRIVRLNNI